MAGRSLALCVMVMGTGTVSASTPAPGTLAGLVSSTDVRAGSLSRFAEPVMVYLLMLVIATVLVVMARRVLGFGTGARLAPGMPRGIPSRFGGPAAAGPSGNGPGLEGAGDGHSRVVPFPPSAVDEPEWQAAPPRLGLKGGVGGAAGASGGGPVGARGGGKRVGAADQDSAPAAAGRRSPRGRIQLVGSAGAARGAGVDPVHPPASKVGSPVAVEAPEQVRPAVTRLKLTCSAVPTTVGSALIGGVRPGDRA